MVRRVSFGTLGIAMFLMIWEIIGRAKVVGDAWPPFSQVVATLVEPRYARVLWGSLLTTTSRAALGLAIGSATGLLLAMALVFFPRLERGTYRLAVVLNAIPIVAVGPLLIVAASRELVPVIIAAFGVFFTTFVAVLAGFSRGNESEHDVFSVLGSSRWVRFRHLQLPGAVAMILGAFKVSVPIAMIGAIFGEWFGAERGLGLIMLNAMDNYQMGVLWATALLASLPTTAVYGVLALLEHLAARRYPPTTAEKGTQDLGKRRSSVFARAWAGASAFWAVGLILLLWQLWVSTANVSRIVIPAPAGVLADVILDFSAYGGHVLHTVGTATTGMVIGMLGAIFVAMIVSLSTVLNGTVMPASLFLRSVPIVAWTPVLARVLGFGDATVIAAAALITFFPTFVLALSGLRARPAGSDDLFSVLAANRITRLLRLDLPAALPNILVSLRIAAANAFLAAIVAESLIGIAGLGYLFGEARGLFAINRAWGAVILASALSILAFLAATWTEQRGRERWS